MATIIEQYSYNTTANSSTSAAVFRDHGGTILWLSSDKVNVTDCLYGETLAVCLAADKALHMGYQEFVFYCDNLQVELIYAN
ncbi:hypothetical protein F8388_015963 [Cannabis sativa]|uniref:RNase H type-1 domain-containing protein n=1 Tax=Cannabis sativa TaxID=3483 RepID=A0A7J6ENU7_CANSA|nr:hypothetical protein F8388_015963 [Cannabis sativa]KAF4363245.1 hypothetical protein G4B88_015999 [Cannabis sativa]